MEELCEEKPFYKNFRLQNAGLLMRTLFLAQNNCSSNTRRYDQGLFYWGFCILPPTSSFLPPPWCGSVSTKLNRTLNERLCY